MIKWFWFLNVIFITIDLWASDPILADCSLDLALPPREFIVITRDGKQRVIQAGSYIELQEKARKIVAESERHTDKFTDSTHIMLITEQPDPTNGILQLVKEDNFLKIGPKIRAAPIPYADFSWYLK